MKAETIAPDTLAEFERLMDPDFRGKEWARAASSFVQVRGPAILSLLRDSVGWDWLKSQGVDAHGWHDGIYCDEWESIVESLQKKHVNQGPQQ